MLESNCSTSPETFEFNAAMPRWCESWSQLPNPVIAIATAMRPVARHAIGGL